MKVLLDNNVNYRFGKLLFGHEIVHVQDRGWESLVNGKLLTEAEKAGFQVLITADKQMQHQQNMKSRNICIVILGSKKITLKSIAPLAPQILDVLAGEIQPGTIIFALPI